jgi:hypothetical protein
MLDCHCIISVGPATRLSYVAFKTKIKKFLGMATEKKEKYKRAVLMGFVLESYRLFLLPSFLDYRQIGLAIGHVN